MGEGFSNAIVGGVGKLVRAFIQSPNYLAGKTGWSINKDGSVDFNNGTFRSNVIITDNAGNVVTVIDANGIKVTNGGPTSTAYVLIRTNPATGVPQITFNPEAVSGVTVNQASMLTQPPSSGTPNGNTGPSMVISGASQDALTAARIELRGQGKVDNSRITLTANDVASPPILFRDASGTVETWHDVVLANGWVNQANPVVPGSPHPLRVQKVPSPANNAQIVGVLTGPANGTLAVGNVPTGYIPTYRVPVFAYGSPNSGIPMFIIEPTTGQITPIGIGANASVWVNGIYPLD